MEDENRIEDSHLKLDLGNRDPDDGMTDVAYVKGAFFLKTLEEKVGREEMDRFLNKYFNAHKFETLTTEDFVEYLNANLLAPLDVEFDVEEWIYGPGIPDNIAQIKVEEFDIVQALAQKIKDGGELPKDLERDDKI